MTPAVCDRLCRGYAYFAVQYYGECRCASEGWIPKYGKKPSKDCNAPCKGDKKVMCGGPWRNNVYKTTSTDEIAPKQCRKAAKIASAHPLEHTYAVKGAVCTIVANNAEKSRDKGVDDCSKMLDGKLETLARYRTGSSSGFSVVFKLPKPLSIEAVETYVKKPAHKDGGAGYAEPVISVRVKGSEDWAQVYKDDFLWGRAEREAHSATTNLSPEFRFDAWNVHQFDGGPWGQVTSVKLTMQEVDIHHDNSFSINELRLISDRKVDAVEVPVVIEGPGEYMGCFHDKGIRDLPDLIASCNDMTPVVCNQLCLQGGYSFYGTQWYGQCFCAKAGWKPKYGKDQDKACRTPCKGDVGIMCGGGWHNSVHKVESPTAWQKASRKVSKSCQEAADWRRKAKESARHVPTSHPGPGKYMGCYQDHPKRDLPIFKGISREMTAEKCHNRCKGYHYYAMQNSHECRCAPESWKPKYGKKPNQECNKPCTGDVATMCGAGWRNSVFKQPELLHPELPAHAHPLPEPVKRVKVTEHRPAKGAVHPSKAPAPPAASKTLTKSAGGGVHDHGKIGTYLVVVLLLFGGMAGFAYLGHAQGYFQLSFLSAKVATASAAPEGSETPEKARNRYEREPLL